MLRTIWTWLLLAAAMLMSTPASAQSGTGDRLVTLATKFVAQGAVNVRFELSPEAGRVKALRLRARQGSVLIERVIVTYVNAQVHYEDREKPIDLRAGERTAEIDPRDIARAVATVEVELKAPAAAPMQLELLGRQSSTAQAPQTKEPTSAPSPEDDAAPPPTGKKKKKASRKKLAPSGEAPDLDQLPPPAAGVPPSRPFSGTTEQPSRPRSVAAEPKPAFRSVDVYYGTNRRPEAARKVEGRTLASYGSRPGAALSLGRAVVTVPTEGREPGQINRPEFDLVIASFALRGEDPARDFTILAVDQMTEADFANAAREHLAKATTFAKQAFVFVHGYNVSFDEALFRAAQIAHDMAFDGLPLVYSWPSLGGVRGYFLDQRRARESRDGMREFLDLVAAQTGATHIHLIAHSMGANPILEALLMYGPPATAGATPRFSEVILAAPDVLRDDFERIAARIRGHARGMTLFASNNDRALRFSSWATVGESPAGFVPADAPPVIVPGVDTIDVSALNTGFLGLNHSTFADRAALIGDIKALLSDTVRRNPRDRLPAYRPVESPPAGVYWRYQP